MPSSQAGLANVGGGAPAGGGPGYGTNPYTLNTNVTEIGNDAQGFSSRVHREAIEQFMSYEMHFLRDGVWQMLPHQPKTSEQSHPTLYQKWAEMFTLDFEVPDQEGWFTPENRNSPYNYGFAGNYDPLMDEARKILFRVGQYQYTNLAAGITPAESVAHDTFFGGPQSKMTDGLMQDPAGPTLTNCTMYQLSGANLDITVNLGAVFRCKHYAIRFIQKNGLDSTVLPGTVQLQTSVDGTTFTSHYVRPVSDDGGSRVYTPGPGDWRESYEGIAVEVCFCDIPINAQYVRFHITPDSTGNYVVIDELAVYGGVTNAVLGRNMFVGYLGDQLDFTNNGTLSCTAVDVRKKLADNNERSLTDQYPLTDTSDIIYSILHSPTYWPSQAAYSSPFGTTEIGWTQGVPLTGLVYPTFQSQNNNLDGYIKELANGLGWICYPDGNGVMQLYEPPYRQNQASRLFINALDGNQTVRSCKRRRTGKMMRNTIEVISGAVSSGNAGAIVLFEPNSVGKYGPRRVRVNDNVLNTALLRNKAANYALRDYAWYLQTLECIISPGFFMAPREIHAFRAPARPNLYTKASSFPGNLRGAELWANDQLTHHFTVGEWRAEATYRPYVPFAVASPQLTSLIPGTGTPDPLLSLRVGWTALTDPNTQTVNVYVSPTSSTAGFTKVGSTSSSNISYLITTYDGVHAVINGNKYWVYVTGVGVNGLESLPSIVLSAAVGGTAGYTSGWTVGDFAAGLATRTGPDQDGFYSYSFACTWTSPGTLSPVDANLEGFKRMQIYINPFSQPAPAGDPTAIKKDSWQESHDEWEWHGDYIAPGLGWDRVTTTTLSWTLNLRSNHNFAVGEKLYFRMFTSSATSRWRRWGGDDDYNGWPGNVFFYTF